MSETNSKGTPTGLSGNAVKEISSNLRLRVADVFALYVKTKNFHGHISERRFAMTSRCSTSSPRKSLRRVGRRTKSQLC